MNEQYRQLLRDLPAQVLLKQEPADPVEEWPDQVLNAFVRYVDLCNDQVFLHQQRRISDQTWILWRDGITYNFASCPVSAPPGNTSSNEPAAASPSFAVWNLAGETNCPAASILRTHKCGHKTRPQLERSQRRRSIPGGSTRA